MTQLVHHQETDRKEICRDIFQPKKALPIHFGMKKQAIKITQNKKLLHHYQGLRLVTLHANSSTN